MSPVWRGSLGGVARLSSLLLAGLLTLAALTAPAPAHEIRPAVADVTLGEARIEVALSATAEALIAGLDLAGLSDTDAAEGAPRYDALRALPPEALEAELRAAWPRIAAGITVLAGEAPVALALERAEIAPVGDRALPRDSVLHLAAALPRDGSAGRFGWQAANGPLIVRQIVEGPGGYSDFLTDGALSLPMPRAGPAAPRGALATLGHYAAVGFAHIVPAGLDHILFVLGLFFLSLRLRPLLVQVTAFTLAHSVTLALAAFGLVRVPAAIVEPLIAASIVYVAVENILARRLTPWRPAVVFGFGLLHGLGFASVLGAVGLAPGALVLALIGFNIGVELGQLAVLAGAFLLVGLWFGGRPWYRARIAVPASAAIGLAGAWWFVERVAGQVAGG